MLIRDSAFCSILYPFMDLAHCLHHGFGHEKLSPVASGLFVAITITQAVLESCLCYGLCRIMLPCIWAVAHSCMINTWSYDLGFLRDLKLTLEISNDVKNQLGTNLAWRPTRTYAQAGMSWDRNQRRTDKKPVGHQSCLRKGT